MAIDDIYNLMFNGLYKKTNKSGLINTFNYMKDVKNNVFNTL